MTDSVISLCNRALQEGGCRALLSDIGEATPQGTSAALFYTPCREQLLRAAQWGFARKTLTLNELGNQWNNTSIYPWPFRYAYPPDCLKLRYILPVPPRLPAGSSVPVVGYPAIFPLTGPSRTNRFVVSVDDASGIDQKCVLANVCNAMGVYTKNVSNPAMFDPLFSEALVQMLAYKFIVPLSGNIKLKDEFRQAVTEAVLKARAADGNEAIPSSDIRVDWLEARGAPSLSALNLGLIGGCEGLGGWYGGPEDIFWGA